MVILRYKEWLNIPNSEVVWVYDLCSEMPRWSDAKQDYVFTKSPKRIASQEAKDLIAQHDLTCVCRNEHGRIYA